MPRPVSAQSRNEAMMSEKAGRQIPFAKDPVEKLRLLCLQRGASGILGLGKVFRRMDDNHSGDLSFDEFKGGINDTGLTLAKDEMQELFKTFDKDGSGTVKYEEFLRVIRPPMNKFRISLVEKAFNRLDKTEDGVITLEDIKGVYDVKNHPEYQNGTKTEAELLRAFLKKFEENGSVDGKVTQEEFMDYYSGVSASIDQDIYFDYMMRHAWKF